MGEIIEGSPEKGGPERGGPERGGPERGGPERGPDCGLASNKSRAGNVALLEVSG